MNIENILQIPQTVVSGEPDISKQASLFFFKAHLLTMQPAAEYTLRQKIANGINSLAAEYKYRTQGYILSLWDKKNNENIEIPLYNRFSAQYQEIQINKINRLHWSNPPNFFITLTIDFHAYPDIYSGYREMGKEWNRLLSHIKKTDKEVEFLKIYEIQEKHTKNIHIHALMNTKLNRGQILHLIDFLKIGSQMDVKDLTDYYKEKNGCRPTKHDLYYMAVKYILKYLKKDILGNPENINETKNILWALRARSYSFSKKLLQRKRPPSLWLDLAFENNSNQTPELSPRLYLSLFFLQRSVKWAHAYYENSILPGIKQFEFVKIRKYT